jgi:DNA repair exonuclease SbcCD ATPase subunit
MPKVVTSAGLNDFVTTGKITEEFKSEPKLKTTNGAAKVETAEVVPPVEEPKDEPIDTPEAPEDDVADDDDTRAAMEQSEKLRDAIAKKNAVINRKHREMREAKEAAEESERFAEGQYTRARLAEERAAALQRERDDLQAKVVPPEKKAELVKPDPQKFYDDKGQFKAFEYAEELAAYSANKAVADLETRQAEDKRKADLAQAEQLARTRVAEAVKKHPDFKEVMEKADVHTHNAVLQYLSASDHIGEVSYYLATHPEYVEKINALNPLKAIAEIGKLELTFEEKAPSKKDDVAAAKVTASAPAPIKPLTSQSSVNTNTDPAKMSFKELRAYERSRARKR